MLMIYRNSSLKCWVQRRGHIITISYSPELRDQVVPSTVFQRSLEVTESEEIKGSYYLPPQGTQPEVHKCSLISVS